MWKWLYLDQAKSRETSRFQFLAPLKRIQSWDGGGKASSSSVIWFISLHCQECLPQNTPLKKREALDKTRSRCWEDGITRLSTGRTQGPINKESRAPITLPGSCPPTPREAPTDSTDRLHRQTPPRDLAYSLFSLGPTDWLCCWGRDCQWYFL